ncbi:tRNA-dependent cyclodipeptide synthase, partial [Mycobacterium tuberculosis]|uniref:tRNA-dependent cyclodipeptide synthase n=1 Tax=Mycobacterium tuberculosis TaxID=1773 RepID=UPI002350C9BC
MCAAAPLFLAPPALLGVPSSLPCSPPSLPLAALLSARGSGLRASRPPGPALVPPAGRPAACPRPFCSRSRSLPVGLGFLPPSPPWCPPARAPRWPPGA